MLTSTRELAWAAGLFEGEGCIYVQMVRGRPCPKLYLGMTDEDSVRRFHRAVGFGSVEGPVLRLRQPHHKPQWRWTVTNFQGFQAVTALLWFGLGRRRKQKATSTLQVLRTLNVPHGGQTHCKRGHVFDDANTYRSPSRPSERRCRACTRDRNRKVRAA